jgi:hypothetical protein
MASSRGEQQDDDGGHSQEGSEQPLPSATGLPRVLDLADEK